MQMHVHVMLLVLNVSCRMQEFGVVSYTLLLSLIEYKTLVLREDMEAAQQLLSSIPKVFFCLHRTMPTSIMLWMFVTILYMQ